MCICYVIFRLEYGYDVKNLLRVTLQKTDCFDLFQREKYRCCYSTLVECILLNVALTAGIHQRLTSGADEMLPVDLRWG